MVITSVGLRELIACERCNCRWRIPGTNDWTCDMTFTRRYFRPEVPLDCPRQSNRPRLGGWNSDARKILRWLFDHPRGATEEEIARGIGVHLLRVRALVRAKLEPAGEVFRVGDRLHSTARAMTFGVLRTDKG